MYNKLFVNTVVKELAFLEDDDIYIDSEKMKILARRTARFAARNPEGIRPITKKMAEKAIRQLKTIEPEAERFNYIDMAAEASVDSIYYAIGVFLANFDQRDFFENPALRAKEW